MLLDKVLDFYKQQAQNSKFNTLQTEALIVAANNIKLAGTNISAIKEASAEYKRLYIEYGGSWEEFNNSFEQWKERHGSVFKNLQKVGHHALRSGMTLNKIKKDIEKRINHGRFT